MWITCKEAGVHFNLNIVEEFWWDEGIFYVRTKTFLYTVPDGQKESYMKTCEMLGLNSVSYVRRNNHPGDYNYMY